MFPSPRSAIRRVLLGVLPGRMVIDRERRSSGRIYLTFDDGPHAEHTPQLLDALAQFGMKATFFVVGQEAERHPEIVRRIARDGHTLGSHSWHHHPAGETSARRLAEETLRTRDLIEQLTGIRTNLCRPPYGAISAAKLWQLWQLGQTVVLWSVDPRDYASQSRGELEHSLWSCAIQAGDIVLLHDNRPWTLHSVEHFANRCSSHGYVAATLAQLIPSQLHKVPVSSFS